MLIRWPLDRPPLVPPPSTSSPAASHGPVARSLQRSLATAATGSAAASTTRRTAACALRSARAPAAPFPRYYCGFSPLPACGAAASPVYVARTFSAAGEGVGRGNGGARGFAGSAVLRGGEAGGASEMGAVKGTGAAGARGGADGPARQGVVAQARWGGAEGAEGAAAGGRAVVLWDLDNVQPERMEPFDAAARLRDLAASFGSPVDVLAYANRHAFEHVPAWVREQRRERREAVRMAARGEAEEREVRCELCGRRCSGAAALRKHFVSLHQREHEKRMQHLNHASPNPTVPAPLSHVCAPFLFPIAHVPCEQAEAAAEGGVSREAAAVPAGGEGRAAASPRLRAHA
ncbi:unnamed protein product [Closterium sp. Yama58-4]|nr:unnamed protein product [Closterium sp. Yama58-4]